MRNDDVRSPLRMLEYIVIAPDSHQHPPVILQHFDQLAAVSFHELRP
jgi:hypothetical protein